MEKKILNLTQHDISKEQMEVGVYEPTENKEVIKTLITFSEIPSYEKLVARAQSVANIAQSEIGYAKAEHRVAMIGGAPFFMSILEDELARMGIKPVHAFSKRVSREKDGKKVSIFKHLGFVDAKPFIEQGFNSEINSIDLESLKKDYQE